MCNFWHPKSQTTCWQLRLHWMSLSSARWLFDLVYISNPRWCNDWSANLDELRLFSEHKNLEEVVSHLEKELKFLLIRPDGNPAVSGTLCERLMKTLDVPDQQEFEILLKKLASFPEKESMFHLTEFVRRHHSRKVDDTKTRPYLTDPQSIRDFFEQYKKNAVPRNRLDMWKMLSRALVQYETILRGNIHSISTYYLSNNFETLTRSPCYCG